MIPIPKELGLTKPIYEKSSSEAFGPGGINHALKVYDLDVEVVRKIENSGSNFLNTMPSAINFPMRKQKPTVVTGCITLIIRRF